MSVEVIVCVEGRNVALDIEPSDVKGLKKEFDEWCQEDEAMAVRRRAYAPVFSMTNTVSNKKMEIKRKYNFIGGEEIYVSWTPLQLEGSSETETQGTSGTFQQKDFEKSATNNILGEPSVLPDAGSLNHQSTVSGASTNTKVSNNSKRQLELSYSSDDSNRTSFDSDLYDESEDSEEYGEVKEYYTDAEWKRVPKYLKSREKSRLELHEKQNEVIKKRNSDACLKPFQPDQTLKGLSFGKKGGPTKSKPSPNENDTQLKSSAVKRRGESRSPLKTIGNYSQAGQSHTGQETRMGKTIKPIETSSEAGPSKANGGFFEHEALLKLKPDLPQYNIPEILQEKYSEGNDQLQRHIDTLNSTGILYGNARATIIRILTRHLFYNIASNPRDVSADMREGLAKSIVVHYPKYQMSADGVTSYPWNHIFERGMGRGWIANSARSIQNKFRTRKSKKRKSSTSVSDKEGNPALSTTNEAIESMALLMPGRSEKSTIIKGMKETFQIRQNDRKNQMPTSQMLKKYPHLTSYDGEILQVEFKLLQPSSQDLCQNFVKHMPGILALPSCNTRIPFEDDSIKALVLLANSLPRDKRAKGDPKSKITKPELKDLLDVVQLGQDIDLFVCDKIEETQGSIQPYLILVKSPLNNKITRFFLVLDQKPMQIASGSIIKAFDMLFKSFFVFNVKYPLGWRNTFHFLATCFANVFEHGSRSRPDIITPSEQELMKKISQS